MAAMGAALSGTKTHPAFYGTHTLDDGVTHYVGDDVEWKWKTTGSGPRAALTLCGLRLTDFCGTWQLLINAVHARKDLPGKLVTCLECIERADEAL